MCDEREQLIGYVYGECDADEHRRVTGHLEGCEACRQEIGALRSVREDLLAWDVPRHESVWKPFAPARATAWWREVPAWGWAAAASLTFLVGAAGGMATNALVAAERGEAGSAPGSPAVVQASPIGEAEYRALVDRLQQIEVALGEVAAPVGVMNASTPPARAASGPPVVTASAVHERDNQLLGLIEFLNNDLTRNADEIKTLRKDFKEVRDATFRVINASTLGPGGR